MKRNKSTALLIFSGEKETDLAKGIKRTQSWKEVFTPDGESCTSVGYFENTDELLICVFQYWHDGVQLSQKDSKNTQLKKMVSIIANFYSDFVSCSGLPYFRDEDLRERMDFKQYNRKIICAHFHLPPGAVSSLYRSAARDPYISNEIREFDKLRQNRKVILDSYTIEGGWDSHLTSLILKASAPSSGLDSERVFQDISRILISRALLEDVARLKELLLFKSQGLGVNVELTTIISDLECEKQFAAKDFSEAVEIVKEVAKEDRSVENDPGVDKALKDIELWLCKKAYGQCRVAS